MRDTRRSAQTTIPWARAMKSSQVSDDFPLKLYIGGRWCDAQDGDTFVTFDPATGKPLAEVAAANGPDVDAAVAAAKAALAGPWRRALPAERGRILQRAAAIIRRDVERIAFVESLDSGKPLREAKGDVETTARYFEYYAGIADKLQGDTIPLGMDYLSFTLHEPVGVTAHIIPWNFPLVTTARGLAPALAAGNAAIVKPAEETPLTALFLGKVLAEAGLPDGVYNALSGTGEETGAALVSHPDVSHVTFTGSVETGKLVMKACRRSCRLGDAGTRRQIAHRGAGGCRSRQRPRRHHEGDLHPCGPALLRWIAADRRAADRRCPAAAADGGDPGADGGPRHRRSPYRPADLSAAAVPGGRLCDRRAQSRGQYHYRRTSHRDQGAGRRLVLRADLALRSRPTGPAGAGGGIRPGARHPDRRFRPRRRCFWRTTPLSASSPASIPATSPAPCSWPATSMPARSSSTSISPAASRRLSEEQRAAASGGRRVSKPCATTSGSRP